MVLITKYNPDIFFSNFFDTFKTLCQTISCHSITWGIKDIFDEVILFHALLPALT